MAETPHSEGPFRVADLPQNRPVEFHVAPDAAARAALAEDLGIVAIRKLLFTGRISPAGRHGWTLRGTLGATVVQECVVTLEPVTTRIDTEVTRQFVPEARLETPEPGSEVEMPEDDTTEPLSAEISPGAVLEEALALALPDYPRADGVNLGPVEARPEGAEPIAEEETKPFAGLAGLRDKLADSDD